MDEPKVFLWFRCPICGEDAADRVELPGLGAYQQPDFLPISGHYDVSCSACGEMYSAFISVEPEQRYAKLDGHPETDIETLVGYSFEDIYDEQPPDDPFDIFRHAFRQIGRVLEDHGSTTDGYHIVNRMAFVQYFSAFEAYLADTLILHVSFNDEAMASLLKSDKTLREMKVGLSDVLADPSIVRSKIRSHLRTVVYHRFDVVDALYRSALGTGIIGDEKVGSALFGAAVARHDCVHRNGFHTYGVRNTAFLPDYIANIASIMRTIVEKIEAYVSFTDAALPPRPARRYDETDVPF